MNTSKSTANLGCWSSYGACVVIRICSKIKIDITFYENQSQEPNDQENSHSVTKENNLLDATAIEIQNLQVQIYAESKLASFSFMMMSQ